MAKISSGVVKVVEIIGVSEKSFDDAVKQAVKKASKTIKGISGIEVIKHSAKVTDGKLVQYRATIKLAFPVQ